MPLDPRLAERLEFEAEQYPDLTSVPIEEGRTIVREMARETDRIAGGAPSVALLRETSFRGPERRLRVRVYTPVESGERPPVVAYFHSGGWVFGDLDTQDGLCREIAHRAGAVVASVEYRRAPEDPFPAALKDAEAAVRWLGEPGTAARLGYDFGRLAVVGDSVGANLAVGAARRLRSAGPRLSAMVLVCPILAGGQGTASYGEFSTGYGLESTFLAWAWQQYLPDPELRRDPGVVPLEDPDLSGLPSARILTAECDIVRDEGERLGDRLRGAGVPATVTRYPGVIHGFLDYRGLVEEGRRALDEIGAALRAAFSAPGPVAPVPDAPKDG